MAKREQPNGGPSEDVLVDLLRLLQVREVASTLHDDHAGPWGEMPFGATNQLHADAAVEAAMQIQRRLLGLVRGGHHLGSRRQRVPEPEQVEEPLELLVVAIQHRIQGKGRDPKG